MPAPTLVTVAILIWSVGACVYTAQLWKARGVTDQGLLGLAGLGLGSALMAWALIEASPQLALCATAPGWFALALGGVKLQSRARARWHRPPPARVRMLSRVPDVAPDAPWEQNPTYAGIARVGTGFWTAPTPLVGVAPPARASDDEARAHAETDRAQRLAKLFG